MTVTTTANSVTYDGDGATTKFNVPFQFFEPTDLIVTERIVSTGAETVLALTSDYTVLDGDGDVGQVIANSAPPASVKWNIRRATAQTQSIDYTDHDPFPAETHETGLDRVTLIAQDSASEAARSLTFPSTDKSDLSAVIPNSVLRASKYLAFDSSGEPIATAGPTGDSGTPVSSFIGDQLFDDADAATARDTLGAQADLDVISQSDAEAGAATDERIWTAQRVSQAIAALTALPRGYIDGLGLANVEAPDDVDHDLTFKVGECRDDANAANMRLASQLIKQLDAPWAEGTNAGGLFSGSVQPNTWYNAFLIRRDSDGAIDAGFDTDFSAANIPAGYSSPRRLGARRTDGSGNLLPVIQRGDHCDLVTAVQDYNQNNPGAGAHTVTLPNIPPDVEVLAKVLGNADAAGVTQGVILTSLDQADQGPALASGFAHSWANQSFGGTWGELHVWTNTSAQIRARLITNDVNTDLRIWVRGWIDRRGKDD